jgi:Ca2+-binding RTX toxin-like protein
MRPPAAIAAAALSTLLAAIVPSAADASVARVVDHYDNSSSVCGRYPDACHIVWVKYTAAAGERNEVVLARAGDAVDVRDSTATIEPGPGCESTGPHEVRCSSPYGIWRLAVYAGDLADEVTNTTTIFARLVGGSGPDRLTGGPDVDALYAGPGEDQLIAGRGNDQLFDGKDGGAVEPDVLDGGPGYDGVDYTRRTRGVRLDLSDPSFPSGEPGEGDSLVGIEKARSGPGDDVVRGSSAGDLIDTGSGADVIRGGPGNDDLYGGRGGDRMYGDAGADMLDASAGDDTLVGGCGGDNMYGASGDDRLFARDGRRDSVGGGSGVDFARVDRGVDRPFTLEQVDLRSPGACTG